MIENYIIPNYETLHSESRENIVQDIIKCMNRWEEKNAGLYLYGDLYVADEFMLEKGLCVNGE